MDYRRAHVYASRNRPVSGLWACLSCLSPARAVSADRQAGGADTAADRADIPGAVYVDADCAETGIWTWVVTPAPLDAETIRRYELTWAWSPIPRQKEAE